MVEVAVALHIGINDNRYSVVANHTTCVVAVELPHWQHTELLPLLDDRAYERLVALRLDDGVEWVCGTECVPEREDSVVLIVAAIVNFAIHTTIVAVDVAECDWGAECVVERCVEYALLLLRSLDVDFRELLVPSGHSLATYLVEALACNLGLEVLLSALAAY